MIRPASPWAARAALCLTLWMACCALAGAAPAQSTAAMDDADVRGLDAPIRVLVEQNAAAGRALSRGRAPWVAAGAGALAIAGASWAAARRARRRGWGHPPAERAFRELAWRLGLDAPAVDAMRLLGRAAKCAPAGLMLCPRTLDEVGRRAIRQGARLDGVLLDRLVRAARAVRDH